MTRACCRAFLLLSFLSIPQLARARTAEPGSISVGPLLGPTIKLGGPLGGAPAYFTLGGQLEYMVDRTMSLVGDASLGIASTLPLRFHLGGRLRFPDIGGPISPYLQAQFAMGELFNVIGANLFWVGGRAGLGADYFFTAELAAGAMVMFDIGTTTGFRPAWYGTGELLLYAAYRL